MFAAIDVDGPCSSGHAHALLNSSLAALHGIVQPTQRSPQAAPPPLPSTVPHDIHAAPPIPATHEDPPSPPPLDIAPGPAPFHDHLLSSRMPLYVSDEKSEPLVEHRSNRPTSLSGSFAERLRRSSSALASTQEVRRLRNPPASSPLQRSLSFGPQQPVRANYRPSLPPPPSILDIGFQAPQAPEPTTFSVPSRSVSPGSASPVRRGRRSSSPSSPYERRSPRGRATAADSDDLSTLNQSVASTSPTSATRPLQLVIPDQSGFDSTRPNPQLQVTLIEGTPNRSERKCPPTPRAMSNSPAVRLHSTIFQSRATPSPRLSSTSVPCSPALLGPSIPLSARHQRSHSHFGSLGASAASATTGFFSLSVSHGPMALDSSLRGTAFQLPAADSTRGPLSSRYHLFERIGSGEFGKVWRALNPDGRMVALKKLTRGVRGFKELDRMAKVLCRIDTLQPHPNLLHYSRSWQEGERVYLEAELCECGDLRAFVWSLGNRFDEVFMWKIIHQLASGLAHMHRHNIVHLDLKPDNILVTSDETLKIGDFDNSVLLPDEEVHFEEGDGCYLAPEVLNNPADFPADIFSLGLTFLEILTFVKSINGDDVSKAVGSGNRTQIESISNRLQRSKFALSTDLQRLITSMLALEPQQRPTAAAIEEISRVRLNFSST